MHRQIHCIHLHFCIVGPLCLSLKEELKRKHWEFTENIHAQASMRGEGS